MSAGQRDQFDASLLGPLTAEDQAAEAAGLAHAQEVLGAG